MARKPLHRWNAKNLAALYGLTETWTEAVGDLLGPSVQPIGYMHYALQPNPLDGGINDGFNTLFFTDRWTAWCEMALSGEFTGRRLSFDNDLIHSIGPLGMHGIACMAVFDDGPVLISAEHRKARSSKVLHHFLLKAIDVTLGRPPYQQHRRQHDGRVVPIAGTVRPKPPLHSLGRPQSAAIPSPRQPQVTEAPADRPLATEPPTPAPEAIRLPENTAAVWHNMETGRRVVVLADDSVLDYPDLTPVEDEATVRWFTVWPLPPYQWEKLADD